MQRASMILVAMLCVLPAAQAARQSDVKNTKHNLSTSGATGNTKSNSETQICVFCHTPHGANATAVAPLWNRKVGGASNTSTSYAATYTPYNSESLDARMASVQSGWTGQPLGSSKLCLSCHDGTIALGNVINAPGSGLGTAIEVSGATTTTMPAGTEGYTRNLGQNLANDHPISVTYTSTLTTQDGELRSPGSMPMVNSNHPLVGVRSAGQGSGISNLARTGGVGSTRPVLPLEVTTGGGGGTGQVQCTTCHDPHIRETALTTDTTDAADTSKERNIKFLRRNRFQMGTASDTYNDTNDIICLACHQKGHDGTGANSYSWAYSSHGNSAIATQTYATGAANTRQFPQGMPVWKVACLNCHDTHTVTGARRLTRQGATGGVSTLEETCYQCHRPLATSILNNVDTVPDIYTDFQLTYKMPIANASEVHDVGGTTTTDCPGGVAKCGADGVERQSLLNNRHAECPDCHNPHRVVRLHRFDGKVSNTGVFTAGINPASAQDDKEGTHFHKDIAGYTHSNVASGVLRGTWGVEPDYSYANSSKFNTAIPQSSYSVRRGDPGSSSLTDVEATTYPDSKTYVTREYQVCLKCHSSYAYGASPPTTGPSINQNGLVQYSDQAREFHAPTAHQANSTPFGAAAGANAAFDAGNRRSWHPVMRPTLRTPNLRGNMTATKAFNRPWSNDVGNQTMYCSDCHGSGVTAGTYTVVPNSTLVGAGNSDGTGKPWGPHGSANPFILKGTWTEDSGSGDATNLLCVKCHTSNAYTSSTDQGDDSSGFCCDGKGNLHNYHRNKIGSIQCTWCHIAVPHGWKNKALLVNLNDVGPEADATNCPNGGCEVRMGSNSTRVNSDYYTMPPYYLEAKNKIRTFANSGSWVKASCGSNNMGTKIPPTNAPAKTTSSTLTGLDWMKQGDGGVCFSTPP